MRFYELRHSTNPKEIGTTYPQSQTSRDAISIDDPRHLRQQRIGYMKDVYMPEPVVHPDAKLSDLLSTVVTWRLVVSTKLKKVLERATMPEQCQFVEMKVHFLSDQFQYWVLNPLHYNMELVDFPASEIWLCGAGDVKIKQISFVDLKTFEEHNNTLSYPERLVIFRVKLTKNTQADFIQLRDVAGADYYVSEKLKQEIIGQECTGIKFVEVEL
jgi:hypothetical protein